MTAYENRGGIAMELYDTPWEETPSTAWFCSEGCESQYLRAGANPYSTCETCYRDIREYYPAETLHDQFRDHSKLGRTCLRCYEREILATGQPRDDYEGDMIRGGMFFSVGNAEPEAAGFRALDDFTDYVVASPEDARRFNGRALQLIGGGHKVLTAFERIGMWVEGYVTLMAARR